MIPGYLGWKRPASAVPTTAFNFLGDHRIIYASGSRIHAVVGEMIDIRIECYHINCRNGSVILGARALGPAPLRFEAQHKINSSEFTIPFIAFDSGLYKLEIFMLYSMAVPNLLADLEYEGVSVMSNGPLKIDIGDLDDPGEVCGFGQDNVPTCHARSLWQQPGRWRPVVGVSYSPGVPAMDWFPTECRLPSAAEARTAQLRAGAVHAILVGDSLMALQADNWRQHWHAWSLTSHSTAGSLDLALREGLISRIDADIDTSLQQSKRVVIMMNAGLHDSSKLCRPLWDKWWLQLKDTPYDKEWVTNHTGPDHCVQTYLDSLPQLMAAIVRWRSRGVFVAWRTTMASFQVWGNINAGSLCANGCEKGLPNRSKLSAHAPHHDGGISVMRTSVFDKATGVLDKMVAAGVAIVDGWNVSLPRADHGQIGHAIIHFGPELSNLCNKIFVLMAVEHFL